MAELLKYSMFQDVLLPKSRNEEQGDDCGELRLQQLLRFVPKLDHPLSALPVVVFDFETTGLDARDDLIIEIGAIKLEKFEPVAEFSALINPGRALSDQIIKITGITNEMLQGQPSIDMVLDDFLDFIRGAVLIAHNAEFDMAFLRAACLKVGYQIDWPCFCTLKLARHVLPELESKNLDTLATHYQLKFESRHRSIGDVKVTSGVLKQMLAEKHVAFKTWLDVQQIARVI